MRRAFFLLVGLLWLCAAGCASSAPQRATPRAATEEEKKTREDNERGSVLAAIPLIGPILAVGVMGSQIASETAIEGKYRAYDREDEFAADRFALNLLERVTGRIRACQGTMGILERL